MIRDGFGFEGVNKEYDIKWVVWEVRNEYDKKCFLRGGQERIDCCCLGGGQERGG